MVIKGRTYESKHTKKLKHTKQIKHQGRVVQTPIKLTQG